MKNFKLLFSVAAAAAMFGCSSMDISEEEAYSENLPADFSNDEYMAIHPGLRYLQLKDYVNDYNKALTIDAEAKTADINAFDANAETLKELYLDPFVGGYSEADYEEDMSSKEVEDTVAVEVYAYVKDSAEGTRTLDSSKVLTLNLCNVDKKIVYNNKVKPPVISVVHAMIDEPCEEGKDKSVVISDTTYAVKGVKTSPKTVEGAIAPNKMTRLRLFNFWDTEDDLAALKAVPVDTFAISYQYALFGKLHGWAYRRCTESEAAKDIAIPEYPATKLYCDDNGKLKEID